MAALLGGTGGGMELLRLVAVELADDAPELELEEVEEALR